MSLIIHKQELIQAFKSAVKGEEGRIWDTRELVSEINKHTGAFKITSHHIKYVLKFQKYFRGFRSLSNNETQYIFIPKFKSLEKDEV